MNSIKTIACFILSLLLSSCLTQSYEVQSVCEVTDIYNYIVKWEVNPHLDGKVAIYSSLDPDHFDLNNPVAIEDISKGRADLVIKGSLNRRYFLLKFNNDAATVVGVRSQKFPSVANFRDIGGYTNSDHRSVKWGKLYRSGCLDSIDGTCAKRVANMHIQTLIDLRSDAKPLPDGVEIPNYFVLPISTAIKDPMPLIMQHCFKRGDALIYMQDINREMPLSSKESLKEMFRILGDPKSYPVIVSCRFGSIQASLAVALILTALEVPEQTIVDDYLLSNRYLNIRTIASQGAELPLEFQDAITTMYLSDERYIRAAFHELNRRYGSVDQYLQRELGVDEAYKKRLQQLLLE